MLSHQGVAVFVSAADAKIVATCMLVTAPNLLRAGRQHGFLENVVTHPEFRRQGHGRAVVHAALATAWTKNCYHVLLQSGRKDPGVHRFYERCGFESATPRAAALHSLDVTSWHYRNPGEGGYPVAPPERRGGRYPG